MREPPMLYCVEVLIAATAVSAGPLPALVTASATSGLAPDSDKGTAIFEETTEPSTSFVVATALSASFDVLMTPSAIFSAVAAPLARYAVVIALGATPSGLAAVPSPVSVASVAT